MGGKGTDGGRGRITQREGMYVAVYCNSNVYLPCCVWWVRSFFREGTGQHSSKQQVIFDVG